MGSQNGFDNHSRMSVLLLPSLWCPAVRRFFISRSAVRRFPRGAVFHWQMWSRSMCITCLSVCSPALASDWQGIQVESGHAKPQFLWFIHNLDADLISQVLMMCGITTMRRPKCKSVQQAFHGNSKVGIGILRSHQAEHRRAPFHD